MFAAVVALAAAFSNYATTERYAEGSWTLRIAHDDFTGSTACALTSRRPAMVYRVGAVGFRVPSQHNVMDSWYRIDGGAPVRFSDRLPMLWKMGVPLDQGGLDDPLGGLVWVSASDVAGAREIEIRPGPGKHVRRYPLGSFASMRAAARRLGCASDASFTG